MRLCLGGKQIGNGGQEMETEVQVPDGGAEDDHRQEVNHHGGIVVVHCLAPKKRQCQQTTVRGRRGGQEVDYFSITGWVTSKNILLN